MVSNLDGLLPKQKFLSAGGGLKCFLRINLGEAEDQSASGGFDPP